MVIGWCRCRRIVNRNLSEFPDVRWQKIRPSKEPSGSVCLRSLATVILMGFLGGFGLKLTKTL
jgi:hypothetical protein